ncbi:MAG: helix-turn-helix transcriptional regulator [Hyphomicrobium sp.]
MRDFDSSDQSPTLTAREIECLSALTEGLTSEGIARRLSISVPTVTMHLTNARRKLHAATREQAVAIAVRSGLVK